MKKPLKFFTQIAFLCLLFSFCSFSQISKYKTVFKNQCEIYNSSLILFKGTYNVEWNGLGKSGEALAGGMYFYYLTLESDSYSHKESKK